MVPMALSPDEYLSQAGIPRNLTLVLIRTIGTWESFVVPPGRKRLRASWACVTCGTHVQGTTGSPALTETVVPRSLASLLSLTSCVATATRAASSVPATGATMMSTRSILSGGYVIAGATDGQDGPNVP